MANASVATHRSSFIGQHMKHFFRYGILDEVHEAKASDTAQGNTLGTLAVVVEKTIVLTGTLTGGMASDVFNVLFRIDAKRMLAHGYEYGDAGLRPFAESDGSWKPSLPSSRRTMRVPRLA